MKEISILVVEDEKALLEAIRMKLKNSGCSVVTARSATQALEYLSEMHIDAIWLDHYLLGIEDGLDLLASMKSNEAWKSIPVFVVSNTASDDKIKSYLKFGIEKYYVKSEVRLEDVINEVLHSIDHKEHA